MQNQAVALTEDAFHEFLEIWKSEHPGQVLPPEQELRVQARRILRAVELTYRAIPAEKASLFYQL